MNRSAGGSEATTGAQVRARPERREGRSLNRSERGSEANTEAQVRPRASLREGRSLKARTTLLGLLAVLALPAGARADEPEPDVPAEAPPKPRPHRPEFLFAFGTRGMVIPTTGFDPYSTNDLLVQSSLSAGLTFWRAGCVPRRSPPSSGDAGGTSARSRGRELSLFVHRLSVPLELRWQPIPRLALFVRIAPGANRLLASNEGQLRARNWSFGYDESGGVAVMFAKAGRARFWLTGELGYSLAFSAAMNLTTSPDPGDPPRQYGSTALPDLRLGGGLGQLGVGVSF